MSGRHEEWETQMEIWSRLSEQLTVWPLVNIDSYHIVVGAGSGPLIPASFYGLYEGRDIEITGGNPWYSGYPGAVNGMDNSHFTWASAYRTKASRGNDHSAEQSDGDVMVDIPGLDARL